MKVCKLILAATLGLVFVSGGKISLAQGFEPETPNLMNVSYEITAVITGEPINEEGRSMFCQAEGVVGEMFQDVEVWELNLQNNTIAITYSFEGETETISGPLNPTTRTFEASVIYPPETVPGNPSFTSGGSWSISGMFAEDFNSATATLTDIVTTGWVFDSRTVSCETVYSVTATRPASLDLIVESLEWNDTLGGIDFSYSLINGTLPSATTAHLYWADGPNIQNKLDGPPIKIHDIPLDFTVLNDPVRLDGRDLRDAPPEATHLLIVLDEAGALDETNISNNTLSLRRDIFVVPFGVNYRESLGNVLDLNGMESADNVAAAFRQLGGRFRVLDPVYMSASSATSNWEKIKAWVASVREDMQPEDGFVFYIHTHGDYSDSAGPDGFEYEHPVRSQHNPFLYFLDSERKLSTGNEQLQLKTNELIDDDTFASFFRTPEWASIDKLFIIDACFSGGFWDGGDGKDLVSLSRSALIASAPETDFSYSTKLVGDSFFSRALADAISDMVELPTFSFADLANRIKLKGLTYNNVEAIISGFEEYWGESVTPQWSPASFSTEDFGMNFGATAPAYPVLDLQVDPGSVTVSFLTIEGWSYQLQRTSTLQPDTFTNVGDSVVGDGGLADLVDTDPQVPQRIYRVLVSPAP
jgi:hypothetical protein